MTIESITTDPRATVAAEREAERRRTDAQFRAIVAAREGGMSISDIMAGLSCVDFNPAAVGGAEGMVLEALTQHYQESTAMADVKSESDAMADVKSESDMADLLADMMRSGPLPIDDIESGNGDYFWFTAEDGRCWTIRVEESGFNSLAAVRDHGSENLRRELAAMIAMGDKDSYYRRRVEQVLRERDEAAAPAAVEA
jgi:hypothetical protein